MPDDSKLTEHMKKSERYQIIQEITSDFWSRWVEEVVPEAVIRQKWHETGRNLCPGDVVLIHDSSSLKGKYLLGIVESIKESADSLVRSCKVSYTLPNPKDSSDAYSGGKKIVISRSIQRLTLLLPVEEQEFPVKVEGNKVVEDKTVRKS